MLRKIPKTSFHTTSIRSVQTAASARGNPAHANSEPGKGSVQEMEASGAVKPEDDKETKPRKTMAELDEELRLKMSGLSGDGGASGVEYEDGQPVSMKRSVKNNMFRYI